MFMKSTVTGIAVIASVCVSACAGGKSEQVEDRPAIVRELALALEENFVFPDFADAYAAYLRERPFSNDDKTMSAEKFGEKLTAELQAVHKDAHLRVFPVSPDTNEVDETADKSNEALISAPARIEAAQWLTPKIAYIRFNAFFGEPQTLATLKSFIENHATAETLVVDLRGHRGGGLDEMDVLFPELFAEQTDLLVMETRKSVDEAGASPIKDGRTVIRIDSPSNVVRRKHIVIPNENPLLLDAKVYVLTSGYTASAAEHFSLSLKRTGRATIVGQATRGGAHFGGTVDIGVGYAAFIPVGRTFDAETGRDWEGTGVAPDIETPADQALIRALIEAGIEQETAVGIDQGLDYTPPPAPKAH